MLRGTRGSVFHAMWMVMADNQIGDEGTKALGPHLAKLNKLDFLDLAGVSKLTLWHAHACLLWFCVINTVECGDREQHWRGRCNGDRPTPGAPLQHYCVGSRWCVCVGTFCLWRQVW